MTKPGTSRQKELARRLRALCPQMPLADFIAVTEAATAGHLRHLPPSIALEQALSAHVRHAHTEYDALLADGYDRDSARHFVVDEMNLVLAHWGSHFRVNAGPEL
ncbi:MAG: DUF2293 domain-containing protein [Nitratireductor sp.]|nr:DUF2293 domain-containing protein [Nitratireductor sp.]